MVPAKDLKEKTKKIVTKKEYKKMDKNCLFTVAHLTKKLNGQRIPEIRKMATKLYTIAHIAQRAGFCHPTLSAFFPSMNARQQLEVQGDLQQRMFHNA